MRQSNFITHKFGFKKEKRKEQDEIGINLAELDQATTEALMGMVNRIEFKKAINLCYEYLEIENKSLHIEMRTKKSFYFMYSIMNMKRIYEMFKSPGS